MKRFSRLPVMAFGLRADVSSKGLQTGTGAGTESHRTGGDLLRAPNGAPSRFA